MEASTSNSAHSVHSVPAWLIRGCQRFWKTLGWLWSSGINIVLSVIATWLYTASNTDISKIPLSLFFTLLVQHWYIALATFIALTFLVWGVWAISQLPVIPSPRVLQRKYLERCILQTQDLAIEGIPLLPPRVQLDEVFISLRLRPHQSTIDQLLTPQQRKLLREGIYHGQIAREVEAVLIDAERQHELLLKQGTTLFEIEELWQHLDRDHPMAVIQGYPGMGKSTLLLRLMLYMARRHNGKSDPLPIQLSPILLPVLIRLGAYAHFRENVKEGQDASLWEYLRTLDELHDPYTYSWFYHCLEQGQCLVLLDGLDEVSIAAERTQVQDAIKSFIVDVRSKAAGASTHNRFLITSRVAGYDQDAFPTYHHYTLAELTPEQIKDFLPRWCRGVARDDLQIPVSAEMQEQEITRKAAAIEQRLSGAMQDNQGIREMVENPFLLTLLAVMEHRNVAIPRRRVDLYSTTTKVLLETRNEKRHLPIIPEVQAVQRLGPVAYQMQKTQNSFSTHTAILTSFAASIENIDRLSPEDARQEAKAFLERVRLRGGIFVLRTADYYGFFHRTFQEYFAARHLLRGLETGLFTLQDILQLARQQDDLWREPFLQAVAYKTGDEAATAWQIMEQLLESVPGTDKAQHQHDILLAGECLLEAKESSIRPDLERNVVLSLVQAYAEAQQAREFGICEKIENIVRRLLLGLSNENQHSSLLAVLRETMLAMQEKAQQKAVLTILTIIAQDLRHGAPLIFEHLVPPLLALTGLPPVGNFQPVLLSVPPDLELVDLALAALCFLGEPGPVGTSRKLLSADFERYTQQLADYSLQSNLLITPAVIPLKEEDYQRYEQAVMQWNELSRNSIQRKRENAQDRATSIRIQQELLHAANEFCYPADTHLLHMLEHSAANPDQPWEEIWRAYLAEQMTTGTYIDYQQCALLWAVLFPDAQAALATLLSTHLLIPTERRRYVLRFFNTIISELRDLSDSSYFRYLRDLKELSKLSKLGALKALRDSVDLSEFRSLRDLRDLKELGYFIYFRYFRGSDGLRAIGKLESLRSNLLKAQITLNVESNLSTCLPGERGEWLTLLLGRVLQIAVTGDIEAKAGQEIRHIVQIILPFAQSGTDTREVTLDIIRNLPIRTEQEITLVLDLARDTSDTEIKRASAAALRFSRPQDAAWAILEQARNEHIDDVILKAIEERLKNRR